MSNTPIIENLKIVVDQVIPPEPIPTPESGEVVDIAVPNTGGFSDFVGHLGPMGCTLIITTLVLLISAVVLLCCHKKFSNRHLPILSSIGMFAFAVGLFAPSLILTTKALEDMAGEHTTTFNISTTPDSITAATINIEDFKAPIDYPYGYRVLAYVDGTNEGKLISDTGGVINPTIPTSSTDPNLLSDNSYGVKDFTTDTFIPVSADSAIPTEIYTTTESTPVDTPIPLTYAAKLDSTLESGDYAGSIHYEIEALPAPIITFDEALEKAGATRDPVSGLFKMQDMTPEVCAAVTTLQDTTMVDMRADHRTYTVGKLADGRCWTTHNLVLGGDSAIELTPADSDISSNWTLPVSTADWNRSSRDIPYIYRDINNPDSGEDEVFYSWNAATAGTGSSSIELEQDAPSSICPKGWRLPKGGSEGEFMALRAAYDNNYNAINEVFHFALVGSFNPSSGGVYNPGHDSAYWRSRTSSAYPNGAYGLFAYSSYGGYTDGNTTRDMTDGDSIRCIAR